MYVADFTDLDRSIPIPLYYQLKTILLSKIQSGAYPEGTCIPTEIQMAEDLQISRSTVRQAVAELVKEGWLERKISKGTFVCHPPEARTSYIRSFEPFYQQIRRQGKTPRTELLEMKVIEASSSLAEAMGLEPGEKVSPCSAAASPTTTQWSPSATISPGASAACHGSRL